MVNPEQVQQFAQKMLGIYTGGVLTQMIDIGYQTGLFEALKAGPATSAALSARAGLHERYVREWLGAMTTSGFFQYDATTRQYSLPAEHAVLLTGDTARNLSPLGRIINLLGEQVPTLVDRFADGEGIPYDAYRPGFTHSLDDLWRRVYDEQLIDGFLGRFPALTAAMEQGIRVLDIGCGTGHALNVLAEAFPQSMFLGYDLAADGIELACAEATQMGLKNVKFEVMDATHFPAASPYDLIMAFDTIHDLAAPDAVLSRIRRALAPGGAFLMVEFKFSSLLEENIGNPFAPMYYGFSLLHCTPVSLSSGGPGLGAVWGEQTARRLLTEAGFSEITVVDTPRPQNYMFLSRP
ncbi:MAG: methyltransferase domain-containing protein [Verrucomicrobiae bacterium]|nr:methyltransferase domain-containing protein [Verrucomicrobiae bacterium]